MKQYRANYPRDEASQSEGDAAFGGVNCKLAAEKLPPGMVREAVNRSFRDGRAATRAGCIAPPSHNPRIIPTTLAQLAEVDWVVMTLEWDATNGRGLVVSAQDYNVLVGTELDATQELGGSVFLGISDTARQDGSTGRLSVLLGLGAMRAAATTDDTLTLVVSAGWVASQSIGGDARVHLTLEHYAGGTMVLEGTRWVNTGGTKSEQVIERWIQLFIDHAGGAEDVALLTTARNEPRVFVTWPLNDFSARIGAEEFVAKRPTIPETIWGAGTYTDGARREWMLLATEVAIWRCRDGKPPQRYEIPERITAPCDFVASAGKVVLFRGQSSTGSDLPPWEWDGTTLGEWTPVSQNDAGDGTHPVSGGGTAEVVEDRLAIPRGLDEVIFTDILEPTKYDPAASLRIKPGAGGPLVRLFPYANAALLAFKRGSIHIIEQASGNLNSVQVTELTVKHGLAAARAVAQVGADVLYLASTGVFRVSQVIQDRIQTEPVPISDPIEPVFRERVNWAHAAGAVAAVHGEYFYLAVPFDGATGNNVVLVYNTSTGNWEGWHQFAHVTFRVGEDGPTEEFDGLSITQFVLAEWDSTPRLWAVDRERGQVVLLYAGTQDTVIGGGGAGFEIGTDLLTRGYLVSDADTKVFTRAELTTEQWDTGSSWPRWSAEDSTGRSQSLFWPPRERTKYFEFGKARIDLTNANDDHGAPDRQDYAVRIDDGLKLGRGVELDRLAQATDRAPVKATARWVSLRIRSGGGRCDVVQCAVEARQTARQTRRRA